MGLSVAPITTALAAASAARKYHVPLPILWGLLGKETDFGRNISQSSTGARGVSQFEPATARQYGVPYVNSADPKIIQAQIDGAARKLLADFHTSGSWAGAVKAYGGGYTLADVEKKANDLPIKQAFEQTVNPGQDPSALPGQAAKGVYNAGKNVVNAAEAAGHLAATILKWLTQPKYWLRAVELLAGLALGVFGLKMLAATARDTGGAG